MAVTTQSVADLCLAARDASRMLARLDSATKNTALLAIADALEARTPEILEANARDMEAGRESGLSAALLDRLALDEARVASVAADAAEGAGVPEGAILIVAGGGREELAELATQTGVVDLIIPRGGEGLKNALKGVATVPVIYAASGNCHVYVDVTADLEAAERIVLNAKVQRPGVCNAAETLLVHAAAAPTFVPGVLRGLLDAGVELRVDGRTRALAGELAGSLLDASDEDWDTEFLAMILAVKVVDSLEEAIDHVNAHGSGHSEAIVTQDVSAARAFERGVDAACVYVNASTRFTDGGEFGMGAEIGNS